MISAQHSGRTSLAQLLDGVTSVAQQQDVPVNGLSIDSRSLNKGDLFLALTGSRTDGRQFIGPALASGAAAVLYDPAAGFIDVTGGQAPVIPVHQLADRVGLLAARFYQQPSARMRVVGITGTNGKTSVSHFLAQALNGLDQQGPCGLIGTTGYGLQGDLRHASHTTPDAITLQGLLADLADSGARAVAMEVSSHGLVQGRVAGTRFHSAVFTNLSRDHLDYHRDMAEYAAAKALLFKQQDLQVAVLNLDDDYGHRLAKAIRPGVRCLGYSLNGATDREVPNGGLLHGRVGDYNRNGMLLELGYRGDTEVLRLPVIGRFNASNLLAAAGVLLGFGLTLEEVVAGLGQIQCVNGRMQCFGSSHQPLVVVDFAHTPDALQQALSTLRELQPRCLICVIGCGGDRDTGKRPVMGRIAAELADSVILTSDNPRSEDPQRILDDMRSGISKPDSLQEFVDRRAAIRQAIGIAGRDDIVLIAGKGHEQVQIIGEQRLPFDDAAEVRMQLEALHP